MKGGTEIGNTACLFVPDGAGFLALLRVGRGSSGYDVENYNKSPGVCLEHLGHASLYNTVWTIIVYAPIEPIDNETTGLERYVQYIEATCSRIIIGLHVVILARL